MIGFQDRWNIEIRNTLQGFEFFLLYLCCVLSRRDELGCSPHPFSPSPSPATPPNSHERETKRIIRERNPKAKNEMISNIDWEQKRTVRNETRSERFVCKRGEDVNIVGVDERTTSRDRKKGWGDSLVYTGKQKGKQKRAERRESRTERGEERSRSPRVCTAGWRCTASEGAERKREDGKEVSV